MAVEMEQTALEEDEQENEIYFLETEVGPECLYGEDRPANENGDGEPDVEPEELDGWVPVVEDDSDVLAQYLKDIAPYPLLSFEQEQALGKRIARGREALKKLKKGKLRKFQRTKLASQYDDAAVAVDALVMGNLRFVVGRARKKIGQGVALMDLIQEGNGGLREAAWRFDYKRDNTFLTFAGYWVRRQMDTIIADQGRAMRIPPSAFFAIGRVIRARSTLEQTDGGDGRLDVGKVAELVDETPEVVEQRLRDLITVGGTMEFDSPSGSDGEATLFDFVEDEDAPDCEQAVDKNLLKERMGKLLDTLPIRERRVLEMHFGLITGEGMILDDVGRKIGYTREGARQIMIRALRRLRHPRRARLLKDFIK
jgi:RNA polymerase primary sigma factor